MDFFVPVVFLIAATVVFRLTDLDLKITNYFFDSQLNGFAEDVSPWRFFYKYGEYPAIIAAIVAGIIFVFGFFKKTLRNYRFRSLFVVMLLIIGPGSLLIVFLKKIGDVQDPENVRFLVETNSLNTLGLQTLSVPKAGNRFRADMPPWDFLCSFHISSTEPVVKIKKPCSGCLLDWCTAV